jgi:hypothetical protein
VTNYDPPTPDRKDSAHLAARVVIAAVPVVGSPALELFNAVVSPPLERRRKEWMETIGEGLRRLEEQRSLDLANLPNIDTFVDAAVQATMAALRTSDEEKKVALAAAVLNSALPDSPDAAVQQIFIGLVDELTSLHLRTLAFFCSSQQATANRAASSPTLETGGAVDLLVAHYPELRGRQELLRQVWRDLYTRGLVSMDTIHSTSAGSGLRASRTSPFGEAFLKFVSQPV